MSETVLETENLDKSYKLGEHEVRALSDISFQVKRGEFVSIMGPSGSGKTTLLNMLGCLDRPTRGKVAIDGVDITKVPENRLYETRRNKVGFVFQNFNLLPYLNATENVELPMEGAGKSKNERRKRAQELLERVGLSEREDHRPNRLSAGEQQRVAIARALANNPAIILADEPTGNLDQKTGLDIVGLMRKLSADQGTTIIMVTHDSRMASETERIFFLSDGKLVDKEKEGLITDKEMKCLSCGRALPDDAEYCPHCGRNLGRALTDG